MNETANVTSPAGADPNGVGALAQIALGSVLLALGFTDVIAARWALAVQAVVGLLAQLWARRHAWAPLSVLAAVDAARSRWEAEQPMAELDATVGLSDEDVDRIATKLQALRRRPVPRTR